MQYQDHCVTAADVRRAAREVVRRRHMRERELAQRNQQDVPPAPAPPLAQLPDHELVAVLMPARQRILELLKPPDPPRFHRLTEVMTEICLGFEIGMLDLVGDRQDRLCSVPRNVSYLLCRILTPASSTRIGQAHGGRDHSTVLAQIKKLVWLREKLNADLTLEDPVPVWVGASIEHLNSRWEVCA